MGSENEIYIRGNADLFFTAFDNSPVLMLITGLDGKIFAANKLFLEFTGYSLEEILGKTTIEVGFYINPNQRQLLLKEILEKGNIHAMELDFRIKDGSIRNFLVSSNIIRINSEQRLFTSLVDITERKKIEIQLSENEAKYKYLFMNYPQPMWIYDTDSLTFLEVNNATIEKYGYSREELVGSSISMIRPEEDFDKVIEHHKIPHDKFYNAGVWGHKKKNGEIIFVEILSHALPEIYPAGRIIIAHEVTEMVKAKEEAEKMNKLKSNFLANMSYELRTPLNGILGFSEFLKDNTNEEETRNIAEIIHNGGQRLLSTLNQILDLSSLETKIYEVKKELTNLNKIVKNSYDSFRYEAEKSGLSFNLNLPENEIIINTDAEIISNVLENLIDNAIKYTPEGFIEISLINKETLAIIKIKDSGIGISNDKLEVIFDEFRQASEGRGRSFEGTGLGLSLCRKFINLLGGRIYVKSNVGEGSNFTVELPLISDVKEITKQIETEKDTSTVVSGIQSDKKLRILFVEDDQDSQELVKIICRDKYLLDVVNDGNQAIIKAKQINYDIILMDINLGLGIDGLEATKIIRKLKQYKNVPIVAITAFAMEGDKEEFLENGCSHYLSKPFTIKSLKKLLDSIFINQNNTN